jgi:hypothetical protein
MDLVEELEKVARAEAGDLLMDATLESHAEGILTQWKKTERDARHNLDDAFFEKVARAIRSLKFLETEVTASSPPSQLAAVAALQATKIISNQKVLPSWGVCSLKDRIDFSWPVFSHRIRWRSLTIPFLSLDALVQLPFLRSRQ